MEYPWPKVHSSPSAFGTPDLFHHLPCRRSRPLVHELAAQDVANLASVPAFDGWRLLICAVEAVRRRPLARRTHLLLAYIGAACVLLLLAMALVLDVTRLTGGGTDRFRLFARHWRSASPLPRAGRRIWYPPFLPAFLRSSR
jgi:hypothetical protein